MKLKLYSIYDKKSESYSKPFDAYNDNCAKRMVAASMDEASLLRKYPTDYRVDQIGTFNDENGQFENCPEKVIVSEVSNLVPLAIVGDGINVGEGKTVS